MLENYSAAVQAAIKIAKAKLGNRVQVSKGTAVYEGILMPRISQGSPDCIVLKMDSGYNIGIKFVKGVSIELSHTKEPAVPKVPVSESGVHEKPKFKTDSSKPTIAILHTGGTVASKVDYKTGGVASSFTPEDIIGMFPEIAEFANIKSRLVRNMWSQDMRFPHYNILAKEIEKEIRAGARGIVITHGTDTLHITSAALSFALENLSVPVILAGSQRSSDRGSSDAAMNLINAVFFAATADFPAVGVCMHSSSSDDRCWILPACKCRKLHSSRRDAFRPVNSYPYAFVDYRTRKIDWVSKPTKTPGPFRLKLFNEKIKVGILRFRVNMFASEFLFYKDYDGLIVETSGLGNLPTSEIDEFTKEHTKILKSLEELVKGGTVVALSPLAIYGRLNLNVYENQRALQSIGILGNFSDMTTDTSYIKLSWLLSNYPKEAKELFGKNLRGELSDRTEVFFV
ncbi:MAG: Glu-tRNA(Gln) amidotransferase subunit GatD [Candidatus Aenigmarchaeota archaeon]|nr:Glu-tRNA(Gln) amidotransferase subunit GatD [Candidatus Aenigmarchaeota archaeon]